MKKTRILQHVFGGLKSWLCLLLLGELLLICGASCHFFHVIGSAQHSIAQVGWLLVFSSALHLGGYSMITIHSVSELRSSNEPRAIYDRPPVGRKEANLVDQEVEEYLELCRLQDDGNPNCCDVEVPRGP